MHGSPGCGCHHRPDCGLENAEPLRDSKCWFECQQSLRCSISDLMPGLVGTSGQPKEKYWIRCNSPQHSVTLLLYPVPVCCLLCLTRNIDCITIPHIPANSHAQLPYDRLFKRQPHLRHPHNVRRGMLDAMIFSCCYVCVTQAIRKGEHYLALIQISAISKWKIKTYRTVAICIICKQIINISNMENMHLPITKSG